MNSTILRIAEQAAESLGHRAGCIVDVMSVAREPRGGYTVTLYVPEIDERLLLETSKSERLTEQSESI